MVWLAKKRDSTIARTSISITGIVQGVGFRPFVFRLAQGLGLSGWVCNHAGGVSIEAAGTEERLSHFIRRIRDEAPPLAEIISLSHHALPDDDPGAEFTIRESASAPNRSVHIAPDAAVCPDCLKELTDPADRRYRHPFITCTNCGPRYSIITAAPYDRPNTTMAPFPLCPDCQREYQDPLDRRFHAQPIGCHACGPRLELHVTGDDRPARDEDALSRARQLLVEGRIVAVKGIGGYHLAVDAGNEEAVKRVRRKKKRDEKPFAVMVPDLATAHAMAELTHLEERLLTSTEAPIVIVRRRADAPLAPGIAPGNGWIGLLLPYTPLHHLLFGAEDSTDTVPCQAVVMTSANLSAEPILYDDGEDRQRLTDIADATLTHNRAIHIRQDDSVIRVFQGKPLFYRRARGYVPRPIPLPFPCRPLLATGAELKSAVCIADDRQAFLSQHIGDLQSDHVYDAFRHTVTHLTRLLNIEPEIVACDRHPDYLSTVYAESLAYPKSRIQHHHAHMAACMADNGLTGKVIGLVFDGTGHGSDKSVWGGEFLTGDYDDFQRAGHFRAVRLPGGDIAVREPWRMALSYLYQALGETAFHLDHPVTSHLSVHERPIFIAMLEQGFNSPQTSSCGRLFDAVAALLDIRQTVTYDGQAAIELECLAESTDDVLELPFNIDRSPDQLFQIDFSYFFPTILQELRSGTPAAVLARSFHHSVARASAQLCMHISRDTGIDRVVLSGGVFQNRLLTEMIYTDLTQQGLQVFTHRLSPPNDGCIALGQAAIAGWQTRRIS